MSVFTCRDCKQAKPRKYSNLDANARAVHVDANGRKWYGKRCPECNDERLRTQVKKTRKKKKADPTAEAVEASKLDPSNWV